MTCSYFIIAEYDIQLFLLFLQSLRGKSAGYQGLISALRESEGAEDLADLALALKRTNPVIAAELSAELELALGNVKVGLFVRVCIHINFFLKLS